MNEQLLPLNNEQGDASTISGAQPLSFPQQTAVRQEPTLPRGSSLLERIRAQREREAAMETSTNQTGGYSPPMADGGAGSPTLGRVSMSFGEDGFANEATQGLLSGSGPTTAAASVDDYSMKEYFLTFVMDMYTLFRSIPMLAQVLLIAVAIYLIWILI